MGDPDANRTEMPQSAQDSTEKLSEGAKQGTVGVRPEGKASPEGVIGQGKTVGRLKKQLILGVVGALGIGMLVLNFLPSSKGGKHGSSDESAVYANDTMPQEVKEMALKMPEASPAVTASPSTSGYLGSQRASDPFAGYQAGTSQNASTAGGGNSTSSLPRDYQGNAAAQAKIEAEAAARRAPMQVATKLTAGLMVSASGQAEGTTSQNETLANSTPTGAGVTALESQPQLPAGLSLPQESYTPGEIYRDFNDQQSKATFSKAQVQSAGPNVGKPADPALLPYTIFAGTIIAAALETAINTDLPGDVLATVSENVFDSVSGKNLLIPQGSKLLAQYSSNVSFGQSRVQVAWQRMIRPDGLSLSLSNMNGVDPQGASGYPGYVDEHWWEYAKGIGLMALFSIIDGQLQYSIKTADTQGVSDVANAVTSGVDQIGTQYTSNAMNVQPTIIVKQGAKVQVFVNSDLIMPPAKERTVTEKYSIPPKEGDNK